MPEIQLVKAAQIPKGGPVYPSGTRATVEDSYSEWLVSTGRAAFVAEVVEADAPAEDAAEVVEDDAPAKDRPASPVASTPGAERPRRTAPVEAWKAYAASLGVKTTGMKRAQIIQAVESLGK